MCVHNFSQKYFSAYASKVLKPDYYRSFFAPDGLRQMYIKQDAIEPSASFKENKINFTDIAHLFGALERRYNLPVFVDITEIDSINDAYIVFTGGIAKMRQNFSQKNSKKEQDKMTQTKITYNQILKAAQEFLVSDPELYLNKQDIVPTASLSRDLGMDSLDKLQLIMGIEKQLNIQINDDEIMKRKTGNLGEFCQAIYEQINAPLVKETIKTQQTNFLQLIKQRLIRQK